MKPVKFVFLALFFSANFLYVNSKNSPEYLTSDLYTKYVQSKNLLISTAGEDLIHKEEILSTSRLRKETIFNGLFQDEFKLNDIFYDLILENVSLECAEQFKYYLKEISSSAKIPETWVLQMLDAYGKFPSGILSGNLLMLGDFYECINIKGKYESEDLNEWVQVNGKYCSTIVLPGPALIDLISTGNKEQTLAALDLGLRNSASLEELIIHFLTNAFPQIMPLMGTCFPATCSNEDAQQILSSFHKLVLKDLMSQSVLACYTDEKPPPDAGQYAMIVVLSLIALVCIVGTCTDAYGAETFKQRRGMNIALCFSFYTNTKRWLNMKVGSDNLGCFHGLKFFSMMWILQGHIFGASVALLVSNNWDLKTLHEDWSVYPILNGLTAVDTFFVLSGTLVCYNLLRELDKQEGRFNYILFVIHRYLRITPTLMIIIGTFATLVPYVGFGPMWFDIDQTAQDCRSYWWENMLYINNLPQYGNGKCYDLSWYLANEMQFFILSPLVIFPLWKWKKVGFGITAVLLVASVVFPTVITAHFHMPPTFIKQIDRTLLSTSLWADTYAKPWARFGAYLVGIITGYVLYLGKTKPKLFKNLPKAVIIVGWTLSTVFALAIIYGAMFYFDPKNTDETLNSAHAAIYAGFHRVVWSFCIAWIVFACVHGYGGWANKILSLKVFIPLGRLTFCMYLVQLPVMLTYYCRGTEARHFSKYSTVTECFGLTVITGLISYIVSMALESPFMRLEKIIFGSLKNPPKTVKEVKE